MENEEALKGNEEPLNDNGVASKGDADTLKANGNTLTSHFNNIDISPYIYSMRLRSVFSLTPLYCN